MTDKLQHLRETVHIALDGTVTIRDDVTVDDLKKVIRSMRKYPALLAVAEAARISNSALKRGRPQIRGILVEQDFDLAIRESDAALAKLEEVAMP